MEEKKPNLVMLVKPFLYRFVLDLQKGDFKSMSVEILENYVYSRMCTEEEEEKARSEYQHHLDEKEKHHADMYEQKIVIIQDAPKEETKILSPSETTTLLCSTC